MAALGESEEIDMAKRETLKGASGAERIAAAASIIHRLEVNALTAFALGAAISLISVFAYSRSARTESWPRKIQREAEDDREQNERLLSGDMPSKTALPAYGSSV